MICLIQFFDEWLDFRIPELDSLLQLHGTCWNNVVMNQFERNSVEDNSISHFYIVDFPSELVIQHICARSVLIKAVYHLWAHGFTLSAVVEEVSRLPETFLNNYLNSNDSWSIQVNSFGRTLSMDQKQLCRVNFKFLDFKGPVDINAAKLELWISLDFSSQRELPITNLPQVPAYFGRLIARGGMKEEIRKYDLRKRNYLGPTSLDDALALILANISGVKPGALAYDPFVGTASILVALTHFGAVCMGSDIDPRVLRGEMHAGSVERSKIAKNDIKSMPAANSEINQLPTISDSSINTESGSISSSSSSAVKRGIFENFRMYGLPPPELIRMDNHLFDRHIVINNICREEDAATMNGSCKGYGDGGYFDVIVTDPPYGIRAGAKKTGKAGGPLPADYVISEERRLDHIPSTQRYPVEEVMLDLCHTAARSLVRGGILTYLLPTTYDFTLNDLPKHPCLELVVVCHQPLSSRHGRRAVVMRKYRAYTSDLIEEFSAYKTSIMKGEDTGFGLLIGKLEAALDSDAFNNDAVVKSLSSCSSKRKASKDRRRQQRQDGIQYPPKRGYEEQRLIKMRKDSEKTQHLNKISDFKVSN